MAAPTDTIAEETQKQTSTQISEESLTATLQQKLSATHVEVHDMSGGCGQAFNAIIVSPEFEKKTLLQRHRLVNAALKEEIASIHAWTPRCLTVGQWEKEQEGR